MTTKEQERAAIKHIQEELEETRKRCKVLEDDLETAHKAENEALEKYVRYKKVARELMKLLVDETDS